MSEPVPETMRERIYTTIFGTDTPAGRNFDIILIIAILISVVAVILDSISWIHQRYGEQLYILEWCFTLAFTAEYAARLYSSPNPRAYATSFYGVVDVLSIIPTYLSFLIPGAQGAVIIRILRVLRIFRVLRLMRFMSEANVLTRSLFAARRKIIVFLFAVISIIIIFGSLMYAVEGPANGYTSLPRSIYWAIVTITTVGYGDITPQTNLGQALAAIAMITSYAIIAIPTGIISAELISEVQREKTNKRCANCERKGHDSDADYCKHCGAELP